MHNNGKLLLMMNEYENLGATYRLLVACIFSLTNQSKIVACPISWANAMILKGSITIFKKFKQELL